MDFHDLDKQLSVVLMREKYLEAEEACGESDRRSGRSH